MVHRHREPPGHEVGVVDHLFGGIDDATDDATLLEAVEARVAPTWAAMTAMAARPALQIW